MEEAIYSSDRQLNSDIFYNDYYTTNTPVVLRKIFSTESLNAFNLSLLEEQLYDKDVSVSVSKGIFNPNNQDEVWQKTLKLREAIKRTKDESSPLKYYIQQKRLDDLAPDFLKLIEVPKFVYDLGILHFIGLWIGSKGCITPPHYDRSDNFLVQFEGRKKVTMFSPDDSINLYPNEKAEFPHISQVNILQPNYRIHPRFSNARPYHAIIYPGDMLFIPRRWWHHIISLDSCLSVNFWWTPSDFREIKIPIDRQRSLTGIYKGNHGVYLSVFLENNRLYGQMTGSYKYELCPATDNKFFFRESALKNFYIEFCRNSDGDANKLTLFMDGTAMIAHRQPG